MIKINLEKAGYLVSVADDGVQAAKLMDEKQFDLCLFDIMLPKIDGYEIFINNLSVQRNILII